MSSFLSVPYVVVALTTTAIMSAARLDAIAQEGGAKRATAVRTASPPVLDGVPDEASWQAAPALGDFIQREPSDGQPASERTEIRILFDADAVYVAVWAWDSQASGIVPGDAIRDYEVTDADAVIMVFDTFEDEQNGFVFGTTPAGIEYDGQVASAGSGGGFNKVRRVRRGRDQPPYAPARVRGDRGIESGADEYELGGRDAVP